MAAPAKEKADASVEDTVEEDAPKDDESAGEKDDVAKEQKGNDGDDDADDADDADDTAGGDDAEPPEEGKADDTSPQSPDEPSDTATGKLPTDHYTRSKDPKRKSKNGAIKRKRSRKIRQRRTPKIFLDAISVDIPLNVTADLKIAIQKTRIKRIKSIYKRFPVLKREKRKRDEENNDEPMLDDEDDENKDKDSKEKQPKKKKKLENVPQPEQYGSVLDYLEAKYVKGVQLGDMDEDDRNSMDDKSEGQGSVYSGGSFLDDTDLQRDVAEQVMANTTLTKLELEEDDADFFVNVGNLEVEDDQYGENYDPLQDKENQTKKRKKSQASTMPKASSAKKTKKKDSLMDSGKSKKSVASAASTKSKKKSLSSTGKSSKSKAEMEAKKPLIQKAKKAKSKSDSIFKKAAKMIKAMGDDELPRRRTKLKVALTCPSNKKPGDDITFANPHNPGQRLRVKVPKDCFPGGTFKVAVPVKAPSADGDEDDTDHNKFSRDFQELLDDYARAFDDWCSAQSEVDKKFAVYKEKQQKFDPLVKEFPKHLLTPVDANYLKKLVRRARQNKHKRIKTAALKQQETDSVKQESSDEEEDAPERRTFELPTVGYNFPPLVFTPAHFGISEVNRNEVAVKKPTPPKRVVKLPSMGKKFPKEEFDPKDFTTQWLG